MVKESKVFLAFVAAAIGLASSAFAATPTADHIVLGPDWNQPTRCLDANADSLSINEAKVGSTVWADVTASGLNGWGFFGSSLANPPDVNGVPFYTAFPTMRRWYRYGDGQDQSKEDRAPYNPPNANYDYWIGGNGLATPNDNAVDTHFSANHVYKFEGRSLTIDGTIQHCSKGSSICDFGDNVIIKSGLCAFPGAGGGNPAVRMKATVEGDFQFHPGNYANRKALYLDVSLTGGSGKVIRFKLDTGDKSANWYWCGDCTDYEGSLRVLSDASASESHYSILSVSNVVCGGAIEIEAYQHLQLLGANAEVKGKVEVQNLGVFDVVAGTSKVGSLDLQGMLNFNAKTSKLKVSQSLTFGGGSTVSIPAGKEGAVITVPNAVAAETLKEFSAVLARDGITVALKLEDSAETGYKDIVIANPESAKNKTIDIDSEMSLSCGNARYHVNVKNGATLNVVGNAGGAMPINVQEGGSVNVLAQQMLKWETIPSVWLDASAANSISNLWIEEGTYDQGSSTKVLAAQYVVTKNNHYPLINQWFDCREDARTLKLWSDRYDQKGTDGPSGTIIHYLYAHTHPVLVVGGCNGKNYVTFGKVKASDNEAITLLKTDESTIDVTSAYMGRAFFYKNESVTMGTGTSSQKPKYAFFVFGSQNGGGQALVANAALGRGGNTVDKPITTNTSANVTAWVNGTSVSPTAANTLNGGWQVVTLGLNAAFAIDGLGYCANNSKDNCGQNYAEVIFVDQDLTEKQRQTIEIYLAEKWGLQDSYAYPDWYKGNGPATVYGTGTVNLQTDATLGGAFKGTINLNGNALTMEGASLPPTESVINTDSCTGWFDPEDATTCTMQNNNNKSPKERLMWLYDRLGKADGRHALTGAQIDRSPWIDTSAHGFGPVRRWVDYSNDEIIGGGNDGNTLRFREMKNGTGTGNVVSNAFKTLIMVQDSVRGGGQPFVDGNTVLPNSVYTLYKTRIKVAASSPIYPSGTSAILTGGRTYLDGIAVNGSVDGFNGRPEVLSVIPNGDYAPVCFAHLQNSQNIAHREDSFGEIQGEILMWDRVLDDVERNKVEAYLAYKWLGIAQAGYSAMGDATVVGAGTVKAASVDMLPKFGAGFTGTVEVPSVTAFDFTVNTENGVTTCVNPLDLGGGTMVLSGTITVSVNGTGSRPAAGSSIKVFGWGTEPAGVTWNFVQTGTAEARGDLVKKADGIYYEVPTSGMILLVR